MAGRPPLPHTGPLRERRDRRTKRLLANRAVADTLVSVAGILGRPVRISGGSEVGRLADLVARWDGQPYPPLTGLVVRVGRRLAFVPVEQLVEVQRTGLTLGSAPLHPPGLEPPP